MGHNITCAMMTRHFLNRDYATFTDVAVESINTGKHQQVDIISV